MFLWSSSGQKLTLSSGILFIHFLYFCPDFSTSFWLPLTIYPANLLVSRFSLQLLFFPSQPLYPPRTWPTFENPGRKHEWEPQAAKKCFPLFPTTRVLKERNWQASDGMEVGGKLFERRRVAFFSPIYSYFRRGMCLGKGPELSRAVIWTLLLYQFLMHDIFFLMLLEYRCIPASRQHVFGCSQPYFVSCLPPDGTSIHQVFLSILSVPYLTTARSSRIRDWK